jgi:hypothetical protein
MEGSLMPRHKLGKTGLELSALGFGASPLGGAFGVGASAEEPSNWGLDGCPDICALKRHSTNLTFGRPRLLVSATTCCFRA